MSDLAIRHPGAASRVPFILGQLHFQGWVLCPSMHTASPGELFMPECSGYWQGPALDLQTISRSAASSDLNLACAIQIYSSTSSPA